VRIVSLDLVRFGPFAGVSLEFGKKGRNFQVVQGSNEAGKSTALRALTAALFGIPERTVDGYRHGFADLRVGIRLVDRSGQELHIIRRKGRKNTVLDHEGNPLDDAILDPYLRGVELGVFESMFGLDHEALVEGGKDLLAGKGELGASLFGAGAGFANLHRLRIGLRDEADAIFSPRAQKPPLNLALSVYAEARRRSADLALRPSAYRELEGALSAAAERLLGLEEERRQQAASLSRLERLDRVLPRVIERGEVLDSLDELGEVPSLPDGCSLARVQAQTEIGSITAQESLLGGEKQRLQSERDELQVPETLLARSEELEALRDLLGARRKALTDLPGVRARVEAAESEAVAILRELGHPPVLAEVEGLRIDVATRARLRLLQKIHVGLEADGKAMMRNLREADTALSSIRAEQKKLPELKDAGALRRAITRALREGDLEKQSRNLAVQVEVARKRASEQLSALLLWDGSLEEASRLALLPVESVDAFEWEFQALRASKNGGETKAKVLDDERARLKEELERLAADGPLPSDEDLEAARKERQGSWEVIRRVLTDETGIETWSAEDLVQTYERLVQRADDLVDHLRANADRVAGERRLRAELGRSDEARQKLTRELSELGEQVEGLNRRWFEAWETVGIAPLSPAEMRGWLGRHEKLVATVQALDEVTAKRSELEGEIEELRTLVGSELARIGEPPAQAAESLATLLERAAVVASALDQSEQERDRLARELKKSEEALKGLQELQAAWAREVGEWEIAWAETVAVLGLPADVGTEEVEAVLGARESLFEKVDGVAKERVRIWGMEREGQEFADRVIAIVRECATDLGELPPEEAAASLLQRYTKGQKARDRRATIDDRLTEIGGGLADLETRRRLAESTLSDLVRQAGCEAADGLAAVEDKVRKFRDLSTKRQDLDRQLRAEGLALEDLLAQAGAVDPDGLPGEIALVSQRIADLDGELREVRERVGGLKAELARMDGSDEAAQAALEAQEKLSTIGRLTEDYVRLRLAGLVLEREIDRYREESQGPVLRRAGDMFRAMTADAYQGLTSGFEADDRQVLLCRRANGEMVPVEGLSDGTRDQLFLALRLAYLETHLGRGETLPLIVDDVLVNFDDERAKATLVLLGQLAAKTQILFFTHHKRLVELAREAIPAGLLEEHDLDMLQGGGAKAF
jgi:uncharacterized protein YhaN